MGSMPRVDCKGEREASAVSRSGAETHEKKTTRNGRLPLFAVLTNLAAMALPTDWGVIFVPRLPLGYPS